MSTRTAYEIELAAIDEQIAALQSAARAYPVDAERATRYVYRLYHRASLSGSLAELSSVAAAIDEAIHRLGPAPDLYLLKANLDFTLHRLGEAKQDLCSGAGLVESFEGRTLLADISFQEGRYETARRAYESLIEERRTWDTLARLAHWKATMGDPAADRLYVEAEDELTAKQMRSFAWIELRRGLLDLAHGQFDEAASHYECAGRAYSGHWLVDEHVAELLGAEGRFAEAAALLERVIERVARPELQQALGELYACMGEPKRGEPWHERALRAYLASVERGEVHYYHHLTDFYAHVREDGAEALKWARRDLALRDNFSTEGALAWALYLDGQCDTAQQTMKQALASGVRDAQLFFRAAMISQAAGGDGDGDRYLELAAQTNPRYRSFRMHH